MRDQNPIDKMIQDKLRNYPMETPDHLWERIDQQRTFSHKLKNQLRQYKSYLSVLALLLFVGVSTLVIPSFMETSTSSNNVENTIEKAQTIVEEDQEKTEDATTALALISSAKASESPSHNPTLNTDDTQEVPVKEKSKNIVKNENQSTGNLVKQKDDFTLSSAKIITESSNRTVLATTITGAVSQKERPVSLTKKNEKVFDNQLVITTPVIAKSKDKNNATSLFTQQISKLDAPKYSIEGLDLGDPKCAKFSAKIRFDLYVDGIASYDYAFKSLTTKTGEDTNYRDRRSSTEAFYYAFTAGTRFSLVTSNGWALRTGLVYANVGELFKYVNVDAIEPTTGEVSLLEITKTNRFQTFDVPVILGYEMDFKNFVLHVNTGAYINLLFEKKGFILSPDLNPVSLDSRYAEEFGSYSPFRNHVGASLFGSIGINYKLSSHVQLIIEPHFKSNLRSITIDSYSLNQKYLTTGLITGLRFKL